MRSTTASASDRAGWTGRPTKWEASANAGSVCARAPVEALVIRQYAWVTEPADVALEVEKWFEERGYKVETRGTSEGVAVDLVGDINPSVVLREYGSGPDSVLAILAAEQRWLVEEEGRGSVLGETYVDKARERLRRATIA